MILANFFWQVRAVTASINGTWSEPISLGMLATL